MSVLNYTDRREFVQLVSQQLETVSRLSDVSIRVSLEEQSSGGRWVAYQFSAMFYPSPSTPYCAFTDRQQPDELLQPDDIIDSIKYHVSQLERVLNEEIPGLSFHFDVDKRQILFKKPEAV